MWTKNKILQKLSVGEVPIGLELMLGSERIVEIAGWSGFDFVQLDHARLGVFARRN